MSCNITGVRHIFYSAHIHHRLRNRMPLQQHASVDWRCLRGIDQYRFKMQLNFILMEWQRKGLTQTASFHLCPSNPTRLRKLCPPSKTVFEHNFKWWKAAQHKPQTCQFNQTFLPLNQELATLTCFAKRLFWPSTLLETFLRRQTWKLIVPAPRTVYTGWEMVLWDGKVRDKWTNHHSTPTFDRRASERWQTRWKTWTL